MPIFIRNTAIAIAAIISTAIIAQSANAQVSNRPFAFVGASSGFGSMSPAYKQLMLERKIFGRPAQNNTFIRGLDGNLVNVTRYNNVGYRLSDGGSLIPPSAAWSYFTGNIAAGNGGGSGTGMLPASARPSNSPMNSWIQQLYAAAPATEDAE